MKKELTQGLFRVSAILYARNNSDNISTKQIIRKIIEDALFQNKAEVALSLSILIQFIIDNYAITISEEEICSIIKDKKYSDNFDSYYKGDKLLISLNQKRRIHIEKEAKNKTLHDYIVEFVQSKELDNTKIDVLYKFLYGVFTTNLEGYKQLLKEKTLLKVEDSSFSEEDKVLINKFLDWDNDKKNAAIYNLASYALEYCLLTNKKNTGIDSNNLRNKCLYLDANILFRALGINGDDRRLRTEQFLNQFAKVQQKLMITKETDGEFRDTLDFYSDKIKSAIKPATKVNPKLYVETVDFDGFYKYYYNWKINRSDASVDTFKVHLLAKYDELLKRFKIEKDTQKPYDEDKQIERIKDFASSIRSYNEDKSYSAAEIDARNVIWLEHKRNGINDDIYQVKHFFISSDQHLRRWDYARNSENIPIIMLPSQWLSLILRYVERTENDYKSFVCFLNMKVNRTSLSEEQLLYAIEGISEIATDITEQRNLVKAFVNEDFSKEIQGLSNEEIQKRAKTFAETVYEKRIKELESENNNKGNIIASLKKANSQKEKRIIELVSSNEKQAAQTIKVKDQLDEIGNELERRKDYDEIKAENEKFRLKRWKLPRYIVTILLLIICFTFFILYFAFPSWTYNYANQLLTYVDSLQGVKYDMAKWGVFIIHGGISLFSLNALISLMMIENEEDKKHWLIKLIKFLINK